MQRRTPRLLIFRLALPLALVLIACLANVGHAAETDKPNIVFIFADDK